MCHIFDVFFFNFLNNYESCVSFECVILLFEVLFYRKELVILRRFKTRTIVIKSIVKRPFSFADVLFLTTDAFKEIYHIHASAVGFVEDLICFAGVYASEGISFNDIVAA